MLQTIADAQADLLHQVRELGAATVSALGTIGSELHIIYRIAESGKALNAATSASQTTLVSELRELNTETLATLKEIRNELQVIRKIAESHQIEAAAASAGRYADPLSLARYNTKVYSQVGEDGIVSEIFRRIGCVDRFFVEIGIGDGSENATRFLLECGWRGIWIKASSAGVEAARHLMRNEISSGRLQIVHSLVTVENVNGLLDETGAPAAFDCLSIDIDQNTAHIWKALKRRARVSCIEYNAHMPRSAALSAPYDPTRVWDGSSWYGASLKALEQIGAEKELALVGCDLMGVNAFFVSTAEADGKFQGPFTTEHHFEAARYHALGGGRHFAPAGPRVWTEEHMAHEGHPENAPSMTVTGG